MSFSFKNKVIYDILKITKIGKESIFMNNKKKIVVFIAIILIVILIVILFFTLNKKSNEKELETSLSQMGKKFYENFYYDQINSSTEEANSLLSNFSTIGIKINLENLGKYNNEEFKQDIKKFKNSLTGEKCNSTNTKVIIYPESPYGKTDYKVEVELDCGFQDKEEK